MRPSLLAAIKPREEELQVGDETLVVRELATAAETEAFKEDQDSQYQMLVLCVFHKDDGSPAFTKDDIPAIKAGARRVYLGLLAALSRVNGFDVRAEEKKSEAGPAAG